MKNLGQLMKQAQEMQEKMAEVQAQLEAVELTGVAGGGMVKVTLNGNVTEPMVVDSGAAIMTLTAEVGKRLAEAAKNAGIETVVFDRGGYLFHGRVKALAEGAREGGLIF